MLKPSQELLAVLGNISETEYNQQAMICISDLRSKIPQMQNALAKHDFKELAALCLRIRAGTSTLHMDTLVSLAGAIMLKARNAPEINLLSELVRQLLVEVQNMDLELKNGMNQ